MRVPFPALFFSAPLLGGSDARLKGKTGGNVAHFQSQRDDVELCKLADVG